MEDLQCKNAAQDVTIEKHMEKQSKLEECILLVGVRPLPMTTVLHSHGCYRMKSSICQKMLKELLEKIILNILSLIEGKIVIPILFISRSLKRSKLEVLTWMRRLLSSRPWLISLSI